MRKKTKPSLAAIESAVDSTLFVCVVALWLIVVLIDGDTVGDGSAVVCVRSDLASFWLVWVGPEHPDEHIFCFTNLRVCSSVVVSDCGLNRKKVI